MDVTKITLTELLAKIKTATKRIQKKNEFVLNYMLRWGNVLDPLQKEGGSPDAIAKERDALRDLQANIIAYRKSIRLGNEQTMLTVEGETRSIADWLVWKREIAPLQRALLASMIQRLNQNRNQDRVRSVKSPNDNIDGYPNELIVNFNERELHREYEHLETVLGELDGQLSLLNATTFVDIPAAVLS